MLDGRFSGAACAAVALRLLVVAALAASLAVTGCASKKKDPELKSEKELYDRSFDALNRGRHETAIERYSELEAVYPYGKYTTQGQLEIAYAYYKNKQPELAIAAIDKFIQLHPNHSHVDYAYYLKGLAHVPVQTPKFGEMLFKDQDQFSDHAAVSAREAFAAFKEVVDRFPFSEYAPASRQNMIDLLNVFARNDINIARFYMHRDAHVAAINRARSVVDNYPNSPLTEDALAILVYNYRKLGFDDLAEDAKRVLNYNFPGSSYIASEEAILDKELLERSERTFVFGIFR